MSDTLLSVFDHLLIDLPCASVPKRPSMLVVPTYFVASPIHPLHAVGGYVTLAASPSCLNQIPYLLASVLVDE